MGASENEYVLGTGSDELERLGFQHRLWRDEAFALWKRAGFRSGQTLLDLGCGPGYATLDLASIVGPSGRVIARDASARFVASLAERAERASVDWIDAEVGDAHELSLDDDSLDGAFARWVLCFVESPADVIARVAAVLRPGAMFAVSDYFNQQAETVAPKSPVLDRVFSAIGETWRREGGDPDVAGSVPGLMAAAGLEVVEVRPNVKIGASGSPVWQWIGGVVANFMPVMVAMGTLSEEERAAFEAEWAKRCRDPHSYFCSPPVLDVIGRKPSRSAS